MKAIIAGNLGHKFESVDLLHAKKEDIAGLIQEAGDTLPSDWKLSRSYLEPNLDRLALAGISRAASIKHLRGLNEIHAWMTRIRGCRPSTYGP